MNGDFGNMNNFRSDRKIGITHPEGPFTQQDLLAKFPDMEMVRFQLKGHLVVEIYCPNWEKVDGKTLGLVALALDPFEHTIVDGKPNPFHHTRVDQSLTVDWKDVGRYKVRESFEKWVDAGYPYPEDGKIPNSKE